MRPALLIMAAGLGSRFGGVKQIERVGPRGEILMDYSVYDAVRAGFGKLVFVVKEDILEDVKELSRPVLERLRREGFGDTEVSFAVQKNDIPGAPPTREKPLGTVQAVLSAREHTDSPFLVINADDYYGPEVFSSLLPELAKLREGEGCIALFRLGDTLSESGSVTRGLCRLEGPLLSGIRETYGIRRRGDSIVSEGALCLSPDTPVSMNVWGLRGDIFPRLERYFEGFLQSLRGPEAMTRECLLPDFIGSLVSSRELKVRALETGAAWLGLTNREDVPPVKQALSRLHEMGMY